MGNKSVEDHLDSWGLSKYKEKFKEEGITLDALLVLTKEHINALVSAIRDRALLEAHIQGLKDGINKKPLLTYELVENVEDLNFSSLLNDSNFITIPVASTTRSPSYLTRTLII